MMEDGREFAPESGVDAPVIPALEDIEVTPANVVAALSRVEMEQQATQAATRGRKIAAFRRIAEEIMGDSQAGAAACIYKLPRGGKKLEGGSVRFAEILVYSWGNCRVTARVIEIGREFIIARGQFVDIERNTTTTADVPRRITNSGGQRYNDDMIAVTGNAACAIARRNAVLAGIPKPCWEPIYERAKLVALGTRATMADRRTKLVKRAADMGVTPALIRQALNVSNVDELSLEDLFTLDGMLNAVRDGDATIASAFGADGSESPAKAKGTRGLREALGTGKDGGKGAKAAPTEGTEAPATATRTYRCHIEGCDGEVVQIESGVNCCADHVPQVGAS